jgi:integrase
MAREIDRLTAFSVGRLKAPGMYADGGGLYLQVSGAESVAKSWIFRFMLNGRSREMGLGASHTISLKLAREKAAECRRFCHDGVDPIDARRAERAKARLQAAKSVTFKDCAAAYIAAHKPSWKNAKHAAQWKATLATYADHIIGALPVQQIDTTLVMKVLEQEVRDAATKTAAPLWAARPVTASRLRGRIEVVLDWAKVRGYRDGDNPARWRGHLDKLLAQQSKTGRVRHHPALAFDELPDFIAAMQRQKGVTARALEFLILTATRTGEVVGARPDEIKDQVWTIPADRMKSKKEHRVPLSGRAVEIIQQMKQEHADEYLFPGGKPGRPLSKMAMLELMRRMKREGGKPWSDPHGDPAVPHGFRSTFRDWASERTGYPREVIEMSLAHTIADKVEAAYRRGDLFEKRRRLMAEWSRFCTTARPASDGRVARLMARS